MPLSRYWPLIISLLSCATMIHRTTSLPQINNIRLSKEFINLRHHEVDTISVEFSESGKIKVNMWNNEGYLIKQIFSGKAERGWNHFIWDGKDEEGSIVAEGDYHFLVISYNEAQDTLYDPYKLPWGDIIEPEYQLFDRGGLKFYYTLPCAAAVRIRAGIIGTPLLYCTVTNWEARPSGANVDEWDGYDNSHAINVANIDQLSYNFAAYALPPNSIIMTNGSKEVKSYQVHRELNKSCPHCHNHSVHRRTQCRDPLVGLIKVEASNSIRSNIKFRIDMSKNDRFFMEKERFEIMLFLDGVFIYEEGDGYAPYTYILDASKLSAGNHILSAVLASSGDHIGSGSINFFVNSIAREE